LASRSKAPSPGSSHRPGLPPGYLSELAWGENARDIARLLRSTFSEYPDSLEEADIQRSIRRRDKLFRLIWLEGGPLVSVASAEVDRRRLCVEMTDCATRPDHRGRGLMAYLLSQLEQDVLRWTGIVHLYTLARAGETGMNCVFSKLGYGYAGRLVNNCRMPTGWESMNIWSKRSA
jgi:putative beta-lysine N-acetyltransferase